MRIAFMAAVIALSTPAFAANGDNSQTPTSAADAKQQTSQTAKTNEAERKICKRIDATESRVAATKVCLTAAQWKQREKDSAPF